MAGLVSDCGGAVVCDQRRFAHTVSPLCVGGNPHCGLPYSVEDQRLRLRWRTPVADGWRRRNTTPSHSSHSGTRFQNVKKNRKETWFEKVFSGERCRIEGTRAVLGWGRRQGRFLQTLGFVRIPRGKPLDNFFGGWYILKVSGVALGPDRGRTEASPGRGE